MSQQANSQLSYAAAVAERERWPDVYTVPRARLRARIAAWLVRRIVRGLPIRVTVPGGPSYGAGGPDAPTLAIRNPSAFFRRVGARGLIGFGEAYQAADWDCEDLPGLIEVFARHADSLIPRGLRPLRRIASARRPGAERNSPDGSRRNISRHYDLSDELFALFLDETMTYSGALFAETHVDHGTRDERRGLRPIARYEQLAQAQHRKIDRLLDVTGVGEGTRVLEIGSGWGELAMRAGGRRARVHTITLSANQYAHTRRRIAQAGLADRAAVALCDYREVRGEFDAIVSVEMIEAVGREYLPVYFGVLAERLARGGRIGIQAITMPDHRMAATARSQSWITKYIFPGGLIPSIEAIEQHAAGAGLTIVDDFAFGDHYAQTLRMWRERFNNQADRLRRLGFDETFQRTWNFYLAYCEAGFAAGYLNVHQVVLTHA